MANRFDLTDEIDRMKAYEAKNAIPLPEPDSRWHPSWDMPSTYSADQMHAHAAAVTAAKDAEIAALRETQHKFGQVQHDLLTQIDQLRQYLDTAQRRASALGDEVAGLWEDAARWAKEANDRDDIACAWGAACAFIDSHVADPDITQEMQKTYAEFQKWREHLAARKGTT